MILKFRHDLYTLGPSRVRQQLMSKLGRFRYRLCTLASVSSILILYLLGVFIYPFELNYESDFQYPMHTAEFRYFIENFKHYQHDSALRPINDYSFNYSFNPKHKCEYVPAGSVHSDDEGKHINTTLPVTNPLYPITLLLVVKSGVCDFLNRIVIRQTWGNENRFSDVTIRTVFMLGQCTTPDTTCSNAFFRYPKIVFSKKSDIFRSMIRSNQTVNCQQLIELEHQHYGDLVQADFIDSYYNNTRKTMSTLQWIVNYCPQVPFICFVDDDYYVSVKNLLKFSRNYLQVFQTMNQDPGAGHNDGGPPLDDISINDDETNEDDRRIRMNLAMAKDDNINNNDEEEGEEGNAIQNFNQPLMFDGRLYAGFVFNHSRPQRFLASPWFVNLDEYPYDHYPPYVTGGCFLVNNLTTIDLYYASLFTQPFKYDDVYLGILAHKMNIHLLPYNDRMHFYKLPYNPKTYRNVLATHGYRNPKELWLVWNEQKSLGNA